MKRNYWIYILLLVLLTSLNANAQPWRLIRYEAGVGLGTTQSFMDIGSENFGLTSFRFAGSRPSAFVDASFQILEELSVQLDLSYLQLSGKDPESRTRGYSFVTNSFEPVVRVEYNFFGGGTRTASNALFNRRGMVNNFNSIKFYAFIGAGGILTKAKVKDSDGIEVIGKTGYDNNVHFAPVFPMGIGAKYELSTHWAIGLESGFRLSTSDLLDGYQYTTSQYKDKYILTNVKAIYKIRNDRRGVPQFSRYKR